jgi:hypothetical protein
MIIFSLIHVISSEAIGFHYLFLSETIGMGLPSH